MAMMLSENKEKVKYMTYQSDYQKNYYQPRRPVKSFQDLEVYQKLLAVSVIVTKRIKTIDNSAIEDSTLKIDNGKSNPSSTFDPQPLSSIFNHLSSNLVKVALDLPVKIATAHSMRFSDHEKALATLEEVMLGCNLSVVYLEQFRDLGQTEIETEFFDEQIKTLLTTRGKVLRLQMSWKKFFGEKKQ